MTKVLVELEGWVYLVLVLDGYSKKNVGWRQAEVRSTAQNWLQAVQRGLHQQFPTGGQGAPALPDG